MRPATRECDGTPAPITHGRGTGAARARHLRLPSANSHVITMHQHTHLSLKSSAHKVWCMWWFGGDPNLVHSHSKTKSGYLRTIS